MIQDYFMPLYQDNLSDSNTKFSLFGILEGTC